MMQIDPLHIKEAESILIDGNVFDDERLKFINYHETIDLLAVPGSGKTTALLAKLYCMTKQLPLQDNSGILILAHTNHAIEEIEKVLKPLCPQLFNYPNFIGTVQSFANKFVASQACFELYGSYIRKNGDELFNYEVDKYYYNLKWSNKYDKIKNLRNKLLGLINVGKKNETFQDSENKVVLFLKSCNFDLVNRKIIAGKQTKLKFGGVTESYYVELENWKLSLLSKGILSFKDSFDIATHYLNKNKYLITILQKRFKYIFVDEMQDLDQEQIDLVETIFNTSDSNSVIQRIGDKNQSIYSSNSSGDGILWKTRNELDPIKFPENFSLNNSHRLTPVIGNLVDGFVLKRDKGYKVEGISKNINLKPYLIIYQNEDDANKIKEKYIQLIKEYNLHCNPKNLERGFHIIAWTTDKDEESDKWFLKKLFPEYQREKKQKKDDFNCLRKYLHLFDHEKQTLESIRKSLLNGIIRILRIEEIYVEIESKKYFRKSDLINLIRL